DRAIAGQRAEDSEQKQRRMRHVQDAFVHQTPVRLVVQRFLLACSFFSLSTALRYSLISELNSSLLKRSSWDKNLKVTILETADSRGFVIGAMRSSISKATSRRSCALQPRHDSRTAAASATFMAARARVQAATCRPKPQ